MITFRSIIYRNFLSAGNLPITVELDKHQMTLISGQNGSGKSLILDAICFGLYGRAYRNINKPLLINSINQKQCEVVIEFDIGKKKYKVVRGMKPIKFEIYENDKMINQDPNIKDYQKVLEQQILKMNYRAFTQVVIMGSSSYIPFMKLKPNDRREFVEDLLDIRVFSIMNTLLKEKAKQSKDQVREIEHEIKLLREKVTLQESFIKKQTKEKQDSTLKLDTEVEQLILNNSEIQNEITKLSNKINVLQEQMTQYDGVDEELSELRMKQKAIRKKMDEYNEQKEFYESTEECPMCQQSIHDSHRNTIVGSVEKQIETLEQELETVKAQLDTIVAKTEAIEQLNERVSELNSEVTKLNRVVIGNNATIQSKQKQKQDIENDTSSVDEERARLKEFAKEILSYDKIKKALTEAMQYQSAAAVLLQDTGIKAKIIKQYIPVINKLVNKYLDQLDLFVGFNLNENFEEVVKSRHRDTFTYDSFSEGQKMRIDLALTFAWRDVARLKNSVSCNLIMFDEIGDSSLDLEGTDAFLKLCRNMTDANIFLITHKDVMRDKFDNVIQISVRNNFTVVS